MIMASSSLSNRLYYLSSYFPTNRQNRQFLPSPNLHNRLSIASPNPNPRLFLASHNRLIQAVDADVVESEVVAQQYNLGFVWFLGYITPISLVYIFSFIFGSFFWKFVYQLSISKKVLLQSLLPGILDAEMALVIVLIAAFQSVFRAIAEKHIRIT